MIDQRQHSRENEVGLLGAVMRDGSIYEQAREIVTASSFGWMAYGWLWTCFETIHANGMKIDTITAGDELERMGKINEFCLDGNTSVIKFSGRPALSKIRESGNPKNFLSYAENIMDYAAKRQILQFLNKGAEWAMNGRRARDIIADMHTEFGKVTIYGAEDEFTVPMSVAASEAYDWTDRAARNEVVGIPTGLIDLDKILGSMIEGNVYIVAGRPGQGKTGLLLTIAKIAAQKYKKRVAIFSLEMSRQQVAQRLIAQESEVDLQRIVQGKLQENEWASYINGVEVISGLSIVINDLSSININQIRQTARKIKATGGLDLIVVDYIQLAGSEGTRYERRDLEVSAVSRGLKYLARELNIPILAAAQLSRAVEQRSSRLPILSDLRECLSVATSQVYYNDYVLSAVLECKSVVSLNKTGDATVNKSTVIPKESELVYRVKTRSGRYVDCTANHPLLTTDGFKKLSDIDTTDSIAALLNFGDWSDKQTIPEARLIGWMLGNGSMKGYPAPAFSTGDPVIANEFNNYIHEKWGFTPRPHPHRSANVYQCDLTYSNVRTKDPNVATTWFKEHDLWGRTAKDKKIPLWFFEQANEESVLQLLRGLWETDGSVYNGTLAYATISTALRDQIMYLLAKVGVFAFVDDGYTSKKATTPIYKITIRDKHYVDVFCDKIKLSGYKGERQKELMNKKTKSRLSNKIGFDTSKEIKEYFDKRVPKSCARIQGYGRRTTQWHLEDSLEKLKEYTGVNSTPYDWLCSEHVAWDMVDSIEQMGIERVFDRKVENEHNFVVNGLVVHNSGSLEQDAYAVIFIHDPEEMNAKEMNASKQLIVAKHRNGETGKIDVIFRSAFTKFENAAYKIYDLNRRDLE